MRRIFLGLIAATGLSAMTGSTAAAADMRVVRKAPPAPIAVASWSGFYLGLGFGTRSTRTDATINSFTENGVDALTPGAVGEPLNDTSFRLNPYAGFNWQVAPQWVVGIEADGGFGHKTVTLNGMRYPSSSFITGLAGDAFSVKSTWDASVRGRVGFLPDPSVLVYATGGLAWLHVESTSHCNPLGRCAPGVLGPGVITDARTKTGWTIGGGLEAMLWPNWIARAEYRYADFGTISHADTRTIPTGLVEVVSYDVRARTHTATFGLAYKFLDGNAPAASAIPVKAPMHKAPSPVALPSWGGLYAGLGVGTRSTRTEATVTDVSSSAASLAQVCAFLAPLGGCVTSEPLNDTAFRVGPYLGLNWQAAPQWVLGVEGDWGFADKTTTLAVVSYPASFLMGGANETFSVKTTWDASVRGRVGFLTSPSVLVYATGGVAWLHVESTGTCTAFCGGFRPIAITNSHTKTGWTVGGGLEAMLWGNWIARGEYRYADFGTISNTDQRTLGPDVVTVNYDLRMKAHTATFGLAYKLDRGGPVVAKY
jgi:outer membrane immunogenic protein